jgi:hypothetical protein
VYWLDRDWQQRRDAARAAFGYSRTLLMTAYVRPATLARFDPAAASAFRAVDGSAADVFGHG